MSSKDHQTTRRVLDMLHGRARKLAKGDSLTPPIVNASKYALPGAPDHPFVYGRYDNPGWQAVETAIGALENAPVISFPSGMAAITAALMALAGPGSRILMPSDGYYTVRVLIEDFLRQHGIEVVYVPTREMDAHDLSGFDLIWLETPSNPGLDVCDIAGICTRAHRTGAKVCVDNTSATPLLQDPLALDPHGGAGFIERIAAQPVAQRHGRNGPQLRVVDRLLAVERGGSARRADQRQLAPKPVGVERHADLGRPAIGALRRLHLGDQLAGALDLPADLGLFLGPSLMEGGGVALEGVAASHDLDPRPQIVRRRHLDRQAEPVEQLRAQLALLRIAAADQHEARGMADRKAFALDHVFARGRDIEQQVHQRVRQQVDLVDIQHAAMGLGQQAFMETRLALGQHPLQVQAAGQSLLAGTQREGDERWPPALGIIGQDRRQGPRQGGLGAALGTADQNATDTRIDGIEQQGGLERLLADDSDKGELSRECRHGQALYR